MSRPQVESIALKLDLDESGVWKNTIREWLLKLLRCRGSLGLSCAANKVFRPPKVYVNNFLDYNLERSRKKAIAVHPTRFSELTTGTLE